MSDLSRLDEFMESLEMHLFYDLDGNPCDNETWTRLFQGRSEDPEGAWRIAHTDVTSEVRVSTVWLGLNHCYVPGGMPLIYETMVFGSDCSLRHECERYSTREQAAAGHERMVKRVREALAHSHAVD